MRVIICKFSIIKQDTNFISQTFGQTNLWPLPLQLACPTIFLLGFSIDFEQFFLVKNNFVCIFLKNKYDFQIVCFKKLLNQLICPNEGYFLQIFHYSARYKFYLTNFWSDKLLTTTIVISMPKTYMQGFSCDCEQFFLVKTNLFVYF